MTLFRWAFLVQAAVALAQQFRLLPGHDAHWPDVALLALGLVCVCGSMTRQLPLQNVLAASAGIALLAAAVECIRNIVPLNSIYDERAGPLLFQTVPITVLGIWIIVILSSRGVAKLILPGLRASRFYGLWLIGLTSILVAAFDLALEPYATGLRGHWNQAAPGWHGLHPLNSGIWFGASLVIQAVITPWLIQKKPVEVRPTRTPLTVWVALMVYMGGALAAAGAWPTAAMAWIIAGAVALLHWKLFKEDRGLDQL